jgi:hypothetical protein
MSERTLRATLDLDQTARVPDGIDADTAVAREWANGSVRFGFD